MSDRSPFARQKLPPRVTPQFADIGERALAIGMRNIDQNTAVLQQALGAASEIYQRIQANNREAELGLARGQIMAQYTDSLTRLTLGMAEQSSMFGDPNWEVETALTSTQQLLNQSAPQFQETDDAEITAMQQEYHARWARDSLPQVAGFIGDVYDRDADRRLNNARATFHAASQARAAIGDADGALEILREGAEAGLIPGSVFESGGEADQLLAVAEMATARTDVMEYHADNDANLVDTLDYIGKEYAGWPSSRRGQLQDMIRDLDNTEELDQKANQEPAKSDDVMRTISFFDENGRWPAMSQLAEFRPVENGWTAVQQRQAAESWFDRNQSLANKVRDEDERTEADVQEKATFSFYTEINGFEGELTPEAVVEIGERLGVDPELINREKDQSESQLRARAGEHLTQANAQRAAKDRRALNGFYGEINDYRGVLTGDVIGEIGRRHGVSEQEIHRLTRQSDADLRTEANAARVAGQRAAEAGFHRELLDSYITPDVLVTPEVIQRLGRKHGLPAERIAELSEQSADDLEAGAKQVEATRAARITERDRRAEESFLGAIVDADGTLTPDEIRDLAREHGVSNETALRFMRTSMADLRQQAADQRRVEADQRTRVREAQGLGRLAGAGCVLPGGERRRGGSHAGSRARPRPFPRGARGPDERRDEAERRRLAPRRECSGDRGGHRYARGSRSGAEHLLRGHQHPGRGPAAHPGAGD